MKILFLHPNISYGGASKVLVSVANFYASKGHEVTILTLLDNKIHQEISPQIKVIYNTFSDSNIHIINRLLKVFYIRKFIKKEKYDYCIAFLAPAKSLATIACWKTFTKTILSERGNTLGKQTIKNKITKIIEYIFPPSIFVFQTEYAKAYYPIRKIKERSIIINNALIKHKYIGTYNYNENKNKDIKYILNIARLDTQCKRQEILIKAIALLSTKYKNIRLKFIGDGPDLQKLKNISEQLGIASIVEFCGYKENVYEEILKSYIFCLSSEMEGIPNALMEAMSTGIPCISTDCKPGGARLLINDKTGILTPINDYISLAKAIESYLTNRVYWEQTGKNGYKYIIENFNEEKINRLWEKLIQ